MERYAFIIFIIFYLPWPCAGKIKSQAPAIQSIDKNDFFSLCPKVWVENKFKNLLGQSDFSKNEKLLVCGDKNKGWQNIPKDQIQYFMNNFFRARGYYNSKAIERGHKIFFVSGDKTKIGKIGFQGAPDGFFAEKYIGVDGKTLKKSRLNKIENWAKNRLRALGYPCPQVDIKASTETGDVIVMINPGKKVKIKEIDRTSANGIDPRAISRYDAFQIGHDYNGTLFALTSNRIVQKEIAEFSNFADACDQTSTLKGQFKQEFSQSHHRSVKLEVGASTQEFPIAKLQWNLLRLDKQASQNRVRLHFSNRQQSLKEELIWYAVPSWPRLSVEPNIELGRYAENFYVTHVQRYSLGLHYTADDSRNNYQLRVAPTYRNEKTIKGDASKNVGFLAFEAQVALISHLFEYYLTSPRTGYQLQFSWWGRRQGIGSSQNGNRYRINGTWLNNFGGFSPPVMVLGLRFQVEQLVSDGLKNTPPSMRLYLGGDNNIRGFNRKQINNGGLGFNQTYYLGTEARFTQFMFLNLQPLVFVDIAKAFAENTRFDRLFFWSPGIGLRWASPIGAVRATAGYGMVEGETQVQSPQVNEEWTYFVSLGREF